MSFLDDLLLIDAEEDLRIAHEAKEKEEKEEFERLHPLVVEVEEEWLVRNKLNEKKKKQSAVPAQRETVLKKVHTSKLVWAKCSYFKGSKPFPGRIADLSEAACQKDIPTAILNENELIEFFCLPLMEPVVPQFMIVPGTDVVPYDSALSGMRQLTLLSAFKGSEEGDKQMWDSVRQNKMLNVRVALLSVCQCINVSVFVSVPLSVTEPANDVYCVRDYRPRPM